MAGALSPYRIIRMTFRAAGADVAPTPSDDAVTIEIDVYDDDDR